MKGFNWETIDLIITANWYTTVKYINALYDHTRPQNSRLIRPRCVAEYHAPSTASLTVAYIALSTLLNCVCMCWKFHACYELIILFRRSYHTYIYRYMHRYSIPPPFLCKHMCTTYMP